MHSLMFSHLISSERSKLISLVGSPSCVYVYEVLQRCIHRPIFVLLVALMNLRIVILCLAVFNGD